MWPKVLKDIALRPVAKCKSILACGNAQHPAGQTSTSSWPGIAVQKTASLPLAYVPAIRVFTLKKKDVDARHKAGHDGG
jgi:hypothetical protein